MSTFVLHYFDDENTPFSTHQYSVYKHGSINAANAMAEDPFKGYIAANAEPDTDKQIVIFPSPYQFIPSACSLIKDRFLTLLNRYLVSQGRLPAIQGQIHRQLSYHTDYGKMTQQERERLISGDTFYIDQEFIKDKYCMFLDDVRITGAHEREIEKLLKSEQQYQMVYYALYSGNNPKIESKLNNAHTDCAEKLIPLMMVEDFEFNVRNIRLLLTAPNKYDLLEGLSRSFRNYAQILYDQCIGNQFHLVPLYEKQIKFLHKQLEEHERSQFV